MSHLDFHFFGTSMAISRPHPSVLISHVTFDKCYYLGCSTFGSGLALYFEIVPVSLSNLRVRSPTMTRWLWLGHKGQKGHQRRVVPPFGGLPG